jgi:disulfide oxidoreductase YuzD
VKTAALRKKVENEYLQWTIISSYDPDEDQHDADYSEDIEDKLLHLPLTMESWMKSQTSTYAPVYEQPSNKILFSSFR